jgi:hypothetical protein
MSTVLTVRCSVAGMWPRRRCGGGWSARENTARRQKEGRGGEGSSAVRGGRDQLIRTHSLLCLHPSGGPVPLHLLPSAAMPPPAAVPLLTTPCTQVRRQA